MGHTGTISPTLLDRRLTGCHIEMPKTSALWRHHFIMDSQDEGEALCDTLNANCQQIATAQKVRVLSKSSASRCHGTAEAMAWAGQEADSQRVVELYATLRGVTLSPRDAVVAVRPLALNTREAVGKDKCESPASP